MKPRRKIKNSKAAAERVTYETSKGHMKVNRVGSCDPMTGRITYIWGRKRVHRSVKVVSLGASPAHAGPKKFELPVAQLFIVKSQ